MFFIGWDPGRMYDKIYTIIDGEVYKESSINCICKGYQRTVLEEENNIDEIKNYLDIDVYEEDKYLGRFFLGYMAKQYNLDDLIISSNEIMKYSKDIIKYEKVRMIGYIAYLGYISKLNSKDMNVVIGSGVPTKEFFAKNNELSSIKEDLKKRYTVKFNHSLFNNYQVNINIDLVSFSPEGTATGITTKISVNDNMDLEPNQLLIDELGNDYFVLNLGSSTGDGAMLTEGKFNPKGFIGLNIGSSTVIKQVINDTEEVCGYKTDKITMDYLMMNTTHINYEGNVVDIETIASERYENLLTQVKLNLLNELELRNIKYKNLTSVYLSGGLVETLKKMNYHALKNILPIKTVISTDPLFDEAKGYMIAAISEYEKIKLSAQKGLGFDQSQSDNKKVIKVGWYEKIILEKWRF